MRGSVLWLTSRGNSLIGGNMPQNPSMEGQRMWKLYPLYVCFPLASRTLGTLTWNINRSSDLSHVGQGHSGGTGMRQEAMIVF